MYNGLKIVRRAMALCTLFMVHNAMAAADFWQLNMYRGVTPLSKDMYYLHMLCMAVCAIIGVVVFGVMIYSLIYHRKSKGHQSAHFHENPRLEVVWTLIPFLILIGLAVPATQVLSRMDDTEQADVTIKIVGYQWRWQYQYLDQGISFFSNLATPYGQTQNKQTKNQWYLLEVDKPLVLPINKKIRFLVTANDVIHSWWVPELGVKRDAIPGFMHESWARIEKPGVYRGQCAELCGINHGYMPIVVEAVSEQEFDTWVLKQPKVQEQYATLQPPGTPQENLSFQKLMSIGKNAYENFCAACHRADGLGMPPMYPALKNSSVAVGKPISRHIELILNGIPGSAGMQPYKDQLTDEEIAAITTYERNSWGNNTGDLVQPADVAKLRNIQTPTIVNKVQRGGLQ